MNEANRTFSMAMYEHKKLPYQLSSTDLIPEVLECLATVIETRD
jgi:hypothetical protein